MERTDRARHQALGWRSVGAPGVRAGSVSRVTLTHRSQAGKGGGTWSGEAGCARVGVLPLRLYQGSVGRLARLGWKAKVLLILLCVAAYFTVAYGVLSALAPTRAASAPTKAHTAAATVPVAVAQGDAAAADLVYHATAVAARIERPAAATSPITRDLKIIRLATRTAPRPAKSPGHSTRKRPSKARKPHAKASAATNSGKAAGTGSRATAAVAALRRFAAIAARAEGALYDPSALRALLPQLGSAAARLESAYAPHSGSG